MQERYAPHVAFDLITAASRALCVLSQLLRYLRFKSLVLFVQRRQLLFEPCLGQLVLCARTRHGCQLSHALVDVVRAWLPT